MNTIQATQLTQLAETTYNNLNGSYVASDLLKNKILWHAFIFTRDYIPDILLRDMGEGIWNADVLYILPRHLALQGDKDNLWNLAKGWQPDEIGWVTLPNIIGKVLRLWWD